MQEYDVLHYNLKSNIVKEHTMFYVCLRVIFSTDKEDYVIKIINLETFLKLDDINNIPHDMCEWWLKKQFSVNIKQTRLLKIKRILGKI